MNKIWEDNLDSGMWEYTSMPELHDYNMYKCLTTLRGEIFSFLCIAFLNATRNKAINKI